MPSLENFAGQRLTPEFVVFQGFLVFDGFGDLEAS